MGNRAIIQPKEMVYQPRLSKPEILMAEQYKGMVYYVVSCGSHPCAYVEIPKGNKYYGISCDNIPYELHEAHGGLTYSGNLTNIVGEKDRWFVGWDYAHCDDYMFISSLLGLEELEVGNKHTTMEIMEDCKHFIDNWKEMSDNA